MGISSQRTPPKKRRERSIFGSIFNALMLVVLVEVLLLVHPSTSCRWGRS